MRTRAEIVAVVEAAEKMGAEKVGDNEPTISVKITVNELRKA